MNDLFPANPQPLVVMPVPRKPLADECCVQHICTEATRSSSSGNGPCSVFPLVFYQRSEVCGFLSPSRISLRAPVTSGLGMSRSRISLRICKWRLLRFSYTPHLLRMGDVKAYDEIGTLGKTNTHCLRLRRAQLYIHNFQSNYIPPLNEEKEREKHDTR